MCEGIGVYLYEKKAPNKLRDFIMILGHPDEAVCRTWVHRIQAILRGRQCRDYTPTQWSVIVLSPMDHACFFVV